MESTKGKINYYNYLCLSVSCLYKEILTNFGADVDTAVFRHYETFIYGNGILTWIQSLNLKLVVYTLRTKNEGGQRGLSPRVPVALVSGHLKGSAGLLAC